MTFFLFIFLVDGIELMPYRVVESVMIRNCLGVGYFKNTYEGKPKDDLKSQNAYPIHYKSHKGNMTDHRTWRHMRAYMS